MRRLVLSVGATLCVSVGACLQPSLVLAASGANVWPPTPTASLPTGDGATVFDSATGQLLDTDGAQTWSWDGLRWSQLNPTDSPGLRGSPSLAFDAKTHDVVLFGGRGEQPSGTPDLRDTWTWNGSSWTQARPSTSPAARQRGCAAYDVASGQLVMFGGVTPSTSAAIADTWSWTGSNWVQLHPIASPPAGACAMTYDPDIAALVLMTVGLPQPDGGVPPEAWTWDGTNWSQLPTSLPEAADVPSVAYDVDAGALIVDDPAFHVDGGYNNNIWGGVESEEWRWPGSDWTMLGTTTLTTKITDPGQLVDDHATHQLLLEVGGSTYLCTSPGTSAVTPQRLSGTDRIGTAIAASQAAFADAGSAGAVVLARADGFADALTGGPLAAAKNGPLLLTAPGAFSPRVKTEIQRVLKPGGTVYLLGGEAALAPSIAADISALGDTPVRLSGNDRYGTALAVAQAMGNPATVFEASGISFPDALSAVPAAVATHGVVLLTAGGTLPKAIASYLAAHPGLHYAIGGPAADADQAAIALTGADRYATSAAVAAAIFPNAGGISIASGDTFPDALSGGPIAGRSSQPMLLVPATGALAESDDAFLRTRDGAVTSLTVYGGAAAVGAAMVDATARALAGST